MCNNEKKVFITSDLHIGHKNILKHQPNRIEFMGLKDYNDIEGHDNYIFNLFDTTVKKNDEVFILGDLALLPIEEARKVILKLKRKGANIHLVVGNHDKTNIRLGTLFNSMTPLKEYKFKKTQFPFLDGTFRCVMCHYPLVTWADKTHGSVCLHGHTHNNSPWENTGCDLRLNVGIDTDFAQGKLITLEQVYDWYNKKLDGLTPEEYIQKCTDENPTFVR